MKGVTAERKGWRTDNAVKATGGVGRGNSDRNDSNKDGVE